jgi:hypothetical protein
VKCHVSGTPAPRWPWSAAMCACARADTAHIGRRSSGVLAEVEPLYDMNHRLSNDLLAALREAGQMTTVLLMGVVFGSNYGPFQNGSWHKQALESAQQLVQVADERNELFVRMLPRIAVDVGQRERLGDPEWAREDPPLDVHVGTKPRALKRPCVVALLGGGRCR